MGWRKIADGGGWENAARWDEKKQHANIWPWGDTWDPEKCNNPEDHNPVAGGYKVNQSAPVGSYPSGASPYGCMDMFGNAYEWVADQAKSYPGNPKPFDHAGYHFVKGGCWDDGPFSVRCGYRDGISRRAAAERARATATIWDSAWRANAAKPATRLVRPRYQH